MKKKKAKSQKPKAGRERLLVMAKKKPKTDIPADFQSVDMETVASPHPEVAYDLALHFGANIVGSDEYSVTLQRGQTMVSVNTVQGFDEAVKALGYWFN